MRECCGCVVGFKANCVCGVVVQGEDGEVGGIGGLNRACACYRRTGGRDPVVGRRNGGVGVLCV